VVALQSSIATHLHLKHKDGKSVKTEISEPKSTVHSNGGLSNGGICNGQLDLEKDKSKTKRFVSHLSVIGKNLSTICLAQLSAPRNQVN
jgi:hypothetical protein